MTKRQLKNLAKYLYDVSKIFLATLVIGTIAGQETFNLVLFSTGLSVTMITLLIALLIDRRFKQ